MINPIAPTLGIPAINESGLSEMARRAAVRAAVQHEFTLLEAGSVSGAFCDQMRSLFDLAFCQKSGPSCHWDNPFSDYQVDELERAFKAVRVLRAITTELHTLAVNAADDLKESFDSQKADVENLLEEFGAPAMDDGTSDLEAA